MLASDRIADQTLQQKPVRNQSMDCCKLVASIFVIFIHAHFPGTFGELMDCLARFAVPLFFSISGYFNYRASCEKIVRRLKYIFKLNLIGIAVYILWGWFSTQYQGGSTMDYLLTGLPGARELSLWLLLHLNPFSEHLWYLTALAVCYMIYWAYTRFWGEQKVDYRPLYIAAFCLGVAYFLFDVAVPTVHPDECPWHYRNGWFLGLPMFTMGIFIHEYQQRIFENYPLSDKKLVLMILAGVALSILQWRGCGLIETPFGTFIEVLALMLLLVSHPKLPVSSGWAERLISQFGFLSTSIYILHVALGDFYKLVLRHRIIAILGNAEGYLRPVFVICMSLAASILCMCVRSLIKRYHTKRI